MRIAKQFADRWTLLVTMVVAGGLYVSPGLLEAQDNGVYNASSRVVPSTAFIDAAAYCGTGGSTNCGGSTFDFCAPLQSALAAAITAGGGIVDARGVVAPPGVQGTGGGSQLCNEDPFANISTASNTTPITVLLPASIINMSPSQTGWKGGWVLPNNVRLIGEGEYTGLHVQKNNANYTNSYIIEMGPASGCLLSSNTVPCSGISIEHLTIGGPDCTPNASSNSYNGIVNNYAQDSSYVNDVGLCDIGVTGIKIGPNAANSGPYSNINSNSANTPPNTYCSEGLSNSCPACIDIEAQTRGIHGATCIGAAGVSGNGGPSALTSVGDAAIYVNAGNNSIEDIHIEGFYDGIEVGDISSTVGNVVISNVNGGTNGSGAGPVTNVVHICGPNNNQPTNYQNPCSVSTGTVSDVSVFGVSANSGSCTTAVQDDVTGSSIAPGTQNYNASQFLPLGMYILGEEIGGSGAPGGYSRFSTSPSVENSQPEKCGGTVKYETETSNVPVWGTGNTSPNPLGSGACLTPGALYSNTAGKAGSSVYVCTIAGTWKPIV